VSQEHIDFVLGAYARYNAGERSPELWYFHEDAEYRTSSSHPDSAVHRGIDAIRRQYERWEEAYPDLQVEPVEAKANGDQVFLWVRFSGHGASSGLAIEMELAHVLTLEHARVRRVEEYMDRAEGLQAAGLTEQAGSAG
jgi:ketosteroid isomerase-like protein